MNIPIFGNDNPFAKFIRFGRLNDEHTREEQEAFKNSQGYSQEELEFGRYPLRQWTPGASHQGPQRNQDQICISTWVMSSCDSRRSQQLRSW